MPPAVAFDTAGAGCKLSKLLMLSLVERTGQDAESRTALLCFLEINAPERERLAGLRRFFEDIADNMMEEFYEYLLRHEQTAAFLQDPALVERLKKAQRRHFIELADCCDSEEYFEARLKVGMAHAGVGLRPEYYLGAYSSQLAYVSASASRRFADDDPTELEANLRVVTKVITLDICLATEAYIYGGYVEKSLSEAHQAAAIRAREALAEKEQEERRKEELLRMVVHDIRSPVTAIMAASRAALRRYKDPAEPPGRQFALIEESGKNVLNIIDEILNVAGQATGDMPINALPFDLAVLLEDCVAELRPYAEHTDHFVELSCPGSLPVSWLDPLLVRRVVSNLLVNAFRHTPAGCRVEISAGPLAAATAGGQVAGSETAMTDGVLIRVADNGSGVSARVEKRIFEGEATGVLKTEGASLTTGLGLPFCRLACERLGGSIKLTRQGGLGACFVIEFPAG